MGLRDRQGKRHDMSDSSSYKGLSLTLNEKISQGLPGVDGDKGLKGDIVNY